jgi:hypothetical protein
MSDAQSPMTVVCGSDDTPDSDGVFVSESYLNVLLSLAYPNDGKHCPSCNCRTE